MTRLRGIAAFGWTIALLTTGLSCYLSWIVVEQSATIERHKVLYARLMDRSVRYVALQDSIDESQRQGLID